MIHYLLFSGIPLLLGFAAGLLVGRKNPKVADEAQKFADSVQAAAEKKK